MMKRNTLNSELAIAKAFGFKATSKNSRARNPYLLLDDGTCLLWTAGCLIAHVSTDVHFGRGLHLTRWKSSSLNNPDATLSATVLDADGIGECTKIYYRVAFADVIKYIAAEFNKPAKDVVLDHINHMRGDCRRENLRPADKDQNNKNRSKVKVEKAFYTVEDLKVKLASGEWVPLKG